MPYELKLPDIGEGIAEGEIVRWMVKQGEAVREDQPLVEVMTDKATVEIPSPRTGTIAALLAEEGQVVPVGDVIVRIALAGESADAGVVAAGSAKPGATASQPQSVGATRAASGGVSTSTAPPSGAPAAGGRVQATPAVRQLAKQLGVALETVSGSGPGGAITAQDVEKAAGSGVTGASPAASAAKPGAPAGATKAATSTEERIPLRGLRRLIAKQMRHSLDTAAHYTFVAECDMTEVAKHRAMLKARAEAANIKLTYLAYIVKAMIEPLRRYPMLNASLDDERAEIVLKREIHLGVASHTDEGLTVPVLRHVDRLPLLRVAGEIQRLAAAARAGSLKLEELQGGTITITSTGAKGGVLATPILHHPQVAILGVHEIKKKPAVVNDAIVVRDIGNLSLSLDHRVVDGAVGADFLYAVIERLENPGRFLDEGDIE